jgi:hypothetical protein
MRLADSICPKRIIWASDQQQDGKPAVVPLVPCENTANLSDIVCNSHKPVLLRVLVCKELKERNNQNKCPFTDTPYTGHFNADATKQICNEPKGILFTQIYFRHEKIDKKARSCIIAFIEGNNLHKTDVLLERFKNTVEWLHIVEEKPFYHVVFYGDPLFDNDYTKAEKELGEKMRKLYSQYSKDDEICIIISANKKAEVLRLNYTTIFSVRVQEKNLT